MKTFKELRELREFKTALSFLDLKTATKAEKLAKSMGILKDSEKKGKQYTVYVDGKFKDITKWMKKLDTSENVNEAKMKDIVRKHKRELQKAQKTGNLELSQKAEEDLFQWAMDNGEVKTDDPDDFIEWLDNNLDDIVRGRIK